MLGNMATLEDAVTILSPPGPSVRAKKKAHCHEGKRKSSGKSSQSFGKAGGGRGSNRAGGCRAAAGSLKKQLKRISWEGGG